VFFAVGLCEMDVGARRLGVLTVGATACVVLVCRFARAWMSDLDFPLPRADGRVDASTEISHLLRNSTIA
jgi:hypothetical protein